MNEKNGLDEDEDEDKQGGCVRMAAQRAPKQARAIDIDDHQARKVRAGT